MDIINFNSVGTEYWIYDFLREQSTTDRSACFLPSQNYMGTTDLVDITRAHHRLRVQKKIPILTFKKLKHDGPHFQEKTLRSLPYLQETNEKQSIILLLSIIS